MYKISLVPMHGEELRENGRLSCRVVGAGGPEDQMRIHDDVVLTCGVFVPTPFQAILSHCLYREQTVVCVWDMHGGDGKVDTVYY